MSKEEKAEIAEAEPQEEVQKANADQDGQLESEESLKKEEVDYEAIIAAERQRADEAEKLLAKGRYQTSRIKREAEKEDEEVEEDKPITAKELQEILNRQNQANQKALQEKEALEIARANTSSEEEARAALIFWKNRVVPTGDLDADIKFAIGGLNHKKILATNRELARTLNSRDTISNDSASTQRDGMPKNEPKLPANSPLKEYKHQGNGIYTKKLASGKTLFVNTKAIAGSRRTWTE